MVRTSSPSFSVIIVMIVTTLLLLSSQCTVHAGYIPCNLCQSPLGTHSQVPADRYGQSITLQQSYNGLTVECASFNHAATNGIFYDIDTCHAVRREFAPFCCTSSEDVIMERFNSTTDGMDNGDEDDVVPEEGSLTFGEVLPPDSDDNNNNDFDPDVVLADPMSGAQANNANNANNNANGNNDPQDPQDSNVIVNSNLHINTPNTNNNDNNDGNRVLRRGLRGSSSDNNDVQNSDDSSRTLLQPSEDATETCAELLPNGFPGLGIAAGVDCIGHMNLSCWFAGPYGEPRQYQCICGGRNFGSLFVCREPFGNDNN